MSKHRSICSLFIICIMIFTFSYYVDADENGSNAPLGESCNVYFDVDFMENLFFNTYDLELYLDDTKIGTLAHGKPYTKMHSTTPGKHIITFYKDEDHSVKNSEDIEITKEGTLKCHVEAHSDYITLNEVSFSDSITGNSLMMINVEDMLLNEAISKLKEIGFVNIDGEGTEGEFIFIESNWTVVSQNIEAGKEIDKTEKILLKCKKYDKSKSDKTKSNKTAKEEPVKTESDALNTAKSYLEKDVGFSKKELMHRLEYEGYSQEQIDYAIENCGANWGEQAVKSAKEYLSEGYGISKKGMKELLKEDEYGDKTINYAIKNCGANWGEQALLSAEWYISFDNSITKKELKGKLKDEGFKDKSINYALKHCSISSKKKASSSSKTKNSNSSVLTSSSCKDLKKMFQDKSQDYDLYSSFASKYKGKTIKFKGSIDDVAPHGSRKTRYDILSSVGDYNPDGQRGPTFKFKDVAAYNLGLNTLDLEDEIYRGRNVSITAKVVEFNENTGIFFLDPIKVEKR